MKKLLMTTAAAAAAITMAPTAMAQDGTMDVELTTQQQTMYDGWPAENRATYEGWPTEVRTYYWTLSEPQAKVWWKLNDEQRVALYEMEPTQRDATWQSIAQQVAQRSGTTATRSSASTTGDIRYQSNEMIQSVPTNRVQGEYPICEGDQQDSCIQPRAAGKNWGNRPLDYWPGKPASEMKKDNQ
ncbi:hypothetical protein [Pseudoblastomonas halimionae]|uniref:hypothetical protein n=1 Tax=Alteriqipengyuania halimionae TaxID=1926630 RepID=UPI0018F8CBE2|nr:hypothetical protein [Alteriqipengyuania halimionae]